MSGAIVREHDHTDDHRVLRDGRRVDPSVDGGPVRAPSLSADNDVRFVAALAATKLSRGDWLIRLHLTLELHGRWRHDLDPAYRPDWSGLVNVIDRGLLPRE